MAKVELVQRADKAARAYDPRIHEVRVELCRRVAAHSGDRLRRQLCRRCAAAGAHERVLHRQVGEQQVRRAAARAAAAAFRWIISRATASPEHFAKEAARQAIIQLDAREAPAGEMEVVLGPGWPGILLHEAIGHGLEADFNRKKTSAFSGMLGQRVASDKCTVVDNGTMPGRRGSLNVDDEGNPDREHGADRERHPEGLSRRTSCRRA